VQPLTPTAGARYVLERVADAHYTGRIYTPDATYEYDVRMSDELTLEVRGTAAPEELEDKLRMFARLTARSAPPWPERITRWRGPGRGG
jgi:hypothetical protein